MMMPLFRGSIYFKAASVPLTQPRSITAVTRLNSSAGVSLIDAKTEVIALFTQTSIAPN